ncbi:unnamed protein product [Didymodactylos carnosus]|uniref:NAD(P)(+)--arginine ADP-ribosyltransferase n=1 Tax=Didymodactylos carnosus TaxID=1234261 RepID=A0A814GBK7_9BILA|nr:unnamed protein product [Didymodactylos carnosus]CAF0992941.1 unnamed protein product [Didymodactylos carnosus]CAF3568292.1 unnamed protein product [Didymodactylos carnosus]CAF3764791.1 unnamed protein product [Didymodactylos carnosus]
MIPSNQNDKQRFSNECRIYYQGKQTILKFLDEFEEYYTSKTAIHWYTREGFLFRLINKAFRHRNINVINLLHFFIVDLFNEIKKTSTLQKQDHLVCFRGQLISNIELEALQEKKLIRANSFISATQNYELAKIFARGGAALTNDLQCVMFKIVIDKNAWKTKRFADIVKLSYNEDEEEIFFAAGIVFRSTSIIDDEDDRMWYVWLELYKSDFFPNAFIYILNIVP